MAIVVTNLTHGLTNSQQSTFTTASISPASNNLILLYFIGFNQTAPATISGGGMTNWSLVTSAISSNGFHKLWIYRALQITPGSGAITIDFTPNVSDLCTWSVNQFANVNYTGINGANAIIQSQTNAQASGTNTGITVNLRPFANINNVSFGVVQKDGTNVPSAGSGFTELSVDSSFNNRNEAQYQINAPTVNWTWTSESNVSTGIALEISVPLVGPFPTHLS